MPKILITYHPQDTSKHIDQLYTKLSQHFGRDQVMIGADYDQDENPLPHEFTDYNVMLVVLASDWLSQKPTEDKTLYQTLQTGLKTPNITFIPILLNQVELPNPQDLPPELQEISKHEAVVLRQAPYFDADAEALAEFLEGQRRLGSRGAVYLRMLLAAIITFAMLALLSVMVLG